MPRRRTDEDFDEEVRAHLALEIERLIAEGLSPADAFAAAHRAFGNTATVREQFHESRPWAWIEPFGRDLSYGWRTLRHSPAFVATTVLTLAVGIGLVTAVFTIFNAYALRPFAVRDPQNLYVLSWHGPDSQGRTFSPGDVEGFRARRDVFDRVMAEAMRYLSSGTTTVSASFVSADYFSGLGAPLLLGRGVSDVDLRDAGTPVAVLSYQAWSRLFDRDPAVVGRDLAIEDQHVTVVGVTRPEFEGLDDSPEDVWLPATMLPVLAKAEAGQDRMRVYVRLAPGVSAVQAQGAVVPEPFAARFAGRIDTVRLGVGRISTPIRLTFGLVAVLSPVFAAFGLVLVAACANASNVMLARAQARQREIAVRLSLGASRGRVVRQLLTEGLLIAALAGALGVLLAWTLLRSALALFFQMLPPLVAARARIFSLDFDYRVFGFAVLLATAVTLLFALLPALQATRMTLTAALRGQIGDVRRSTLRSLLIGGQVAVSMVLLIVAATLVRNGVALASADLGLRTAGIVSINQRGDDHILAARVRDVLVADPRVEAVALTSQNPLFGQMEKMPVQQGQLVAVSHQLVTPEYFTLMEIPIVRGRLFRPEEAREGSGVAIISAAGAAAAWPGEEPIGRTLRVPVAATVAAGVTRVDDARPQGDSPTQLLTIVGVARDVVSGLIYEGRDVAHLYLPTRAGDPRAVALLVKSRPGVRLDAETFAPALRTLEAKPQTLEVLPLDDMVTIQMFPVRMASWVGSLLALVALVLSLTGLYGVLVYLLGQRRQEIGIRMALGASAVAVVQLVVRQSARLATWGAAIGLTAAFVSLRILAVFVRLRNVSLVDPIAFAAAIVLAALAVTIASYAPARRATRVDPAVVLRSEG